VIASRASILATLLSASLSVGCYASGRVRLADHPELANVRLAAKANPSDYE